MAARTREACPDRGSPMPPTESRLSAICADILGVERVELDDDLFELGSDSHQAVLVALEIEAVFDVSLPLEVLETRATARALATWVDAQRARPAAKPSVGQATDD